MSNINIGYGIKEVTINNRATLRFNPSDPALYDRFCELLTDLESAGEEITKAVNDTSDDGAVDRWGVPAKSHRIAQVISKLDTDIKERLRYVFGEGNDFNDIFEGVSSFAGTDTGEWVITNFLNAIRPEIEESTQQRMKKQVDTAKANREQRRAGRKA